MKARIFFFLQRIIVPGSCSHRAIIHAPAHRVMDVINQPTSFSTTGAQVYRVPHTSIWLQKSHCNRHRPELPHNKSNRTNWLDIYLSSAGNIYIGVGISLY
jgi:hypothetical protein